MTGMRTDHACYPKIKIGFIQYDEHNVGHADPIVYLTFYETL